MVSGFLTSPWDHCRMSSAVARPMRSSSKKLTSSTEFSSLFAGLTGPVWLIRHGVIWTERGAGAERPAPAPRSAVYIDAARLPPRQVDSELFRRPEDVLVAVLH